MSRNPKVVSYNRSAAYLHHRAMINRRDNRNVDALELMRMAVEAQPDNSEYKLDLAELYCEMGCHEQSSRLLLDMLTDKNAPSECYYGLALNQLGMNDISGARQTLNIYKHRDPRGAHFEDVNRLAYELDLYSSMNRPVNRKLYRAMRVANRACEAMKADQPDKACRLFRSTLKMASEQYEMRALYAMALLMAGDDEGARREADRACRSYPPSAKALCVCAQVYGMLGDRKLAEALINRAEAEHPQGAEARLMMYAAGELGMDDKVAEYARISLQETPYDRELLHIRAVALVRTGADPEEAAKCWERIRRLDPEDSVAQFYRSACEQGTLKNYRLEYAYQVPDEEYYRRVHGISEALGSDAEEVSRRWIDDPSFRRLLRWSADTDDQRLGRASMTVLATLDSDDARSVLRELMFTPGISRELKLHAAVLLKMQGRELAEILPKPMDAMGEALVDSEEILADLPVGDRQLVRYTDEVLEHEYGVSAMPVLALMWQSYRRLRGMRGDPLKRIESAAAALAYNYLLASGARPDIRDLSRAFGCHPRQLVFCAVRIAGCLENNDRG